MKDGNKSSNGEFDSRNIEVDRSFLVHSLDHLDALRGQVIRIRISKMSLKNDHLWNTSCKSRRIIEIGLSKHKQKARAKSLIRTHYKTFYFFNVFFTQHIDFIERFRNKCATIEQNFQKRARWVQRQRAQLDTRKFSERIYCWKNKKMS